MNENIVPQDQLVIFTIGCSNHEAEHFLDLLKGNEITLLVDVRSSPYSAYAKQFNMPNLERKISDTGGIGYLFFGFELGGLPAGQKYRDEMDYIRYDLIEKTEKFQHGIERLLQGVESDRIALMCAEDPPDKCHRGRLLGRVLAAKGVTVLHIRGDGQVQTQEEVFEEANKGQMSLFGQDVAPFLRSSKPHPENEEDSYSYDE